MLQFLMNSMFNPKLHRRNSFLYLVFVLQPSFYLVIMAVLMHSWMNHKLNMSLPLCNLCCSLLNCKDYCNNSRYQISKSSCPRLHRMIRYLFGQYHLISWCKEDHLQSIIIHRLTNSRNLFKLNILELCNLSH